MGSAQRGKPHPAPHAWEPQMCQFRGGGVRELFESLLLASPKALLPGWRGQQ